MHNCYLKKCFTGTILVMLLLARAGYAAVPDTTAKVNKTADMVTGVVVDENNRPVKSAHIVNKDKNSTAETDNGGNFGINAAEGDVLEFTYTNHYVSDITVGSANQVIKVRMLDKYLQTRSDVNMMYQSQSQESLLGSVATVYTNQLTTTPATLYVYALPGQLAGLYTSQGSGFTSVNNGNPLSVFLTGNPITVSGHGIAPTDNTEMGLTVRGNPNGVTTIIDGVERPISSIDPESIESISILKDALSTLPLGINSSKPILLVTTKVPEIGVPRIAFTTETGIQQSLGLPNDQLTAYQWAYLFNEAQQNDGGNALYTTADLNAYKNHTDQYGHPDVNWKKLLLKDYSPLMSDKLNVSGGTDVARYTIGLDYTNQGGIFNEASAVPYSTNNNLSRYALNTNVSVDVNKNLTVDLQLYGKVEQVTEPGNGYAGILGAIFNTPNNAYPVYNPDGSFGGSNAVSNFENNLLSQAQYSGYLLTKVHDVLANVDLKYKLNNFIQGLTFKGKVNVAIESQIEINRSFQNNAYSYSLKADSTFAYNAVGTSSTLGNSFSTTQSSRFSFAQAAFDYNRQFGKSSVSATAFYDTKSYVVSYDIAAVTNDAAFRGAYNYDGKYFVEGIVNNSNFNRYPPGAQAGWFYAGGLGWQMGKESFIKDNLPWIDSWKWRGTYGQTGFNNVGYYTYKQTYGSGNSYPQGVNYSTGNIGGNGEQENTPIANPNVTWEKAHKLDIGADISMMHNQLQITADYYHDKYYDLLQQRGNSIALLGTTYPLENIGINLYYGEELNITYQNHIDNFNYFISGNGNIESSKRVYFDEEPPKYPWLKRTGLPISAIFGYVAEGFYTAADVANKTPTTTGYAAQPGDIKYKDLNNDGVIDQYDQQVIGGLKPLVFYGATLGFNYKGLSFSVILQGVFNRAMFTNNFMNTPFTGLGFIGIPPAGQAYQNALNRWTPETASTATLPRLSAAQGIYNSNNSQFSTFYLKNGNYFRVKNAEIGYMLPGDWSKKLRLSGIRLFVNGENLFTIAGYKGFPGMDPEVNGLGSYPIQRVINAGLTVKL